jgi:hypothetical protein
VYFLQASITSYLNDDEGKLTLITEYETEYRCTKISGVPGQVYTHTYICMTERFLQVSPMNIACKTPRVLHVLLNEYKKI